MLPPEQESGTATLFDIIYAPFIKLTTGSTTSVDISIKPGIQTPTSYDFQVMDVATSIVITTNKVYSATQIYTIGSLTAGKSYLFTIIPKNGSASGLAWTLPIYTLPSTASDVFSNQSGQDDYDSSDRSKMLQKGKPVIEQTKAGQSYLLLSNNSTLQNQYSIAYKSIDAVVPASFTINNSFPLYGNRNAISYSEDYYAFGTSIYFDQSKTSAGLGFFINQEGGQGYYVIIETTILASSKEKKTIRLCKADGSGLITLADTQRTTSTTLEGIFQNQQYNIEIYVKVYQNYVIINCYINGFKISATDYNVQKTSSIYNYILEPTNKVGLICNFGQAYFDYVYGQSVSKKVYEERDSLGNLYTGKFSKGLLNTSFGDIVYNANNAAATLKPESIEDFGTVIREIYHVNTKLKSRPAYPILWSTGANNFASIIGQTVSNFSAEAYVLNNASTTIPLNDGAASKLYIYGNTVGESGDIEYSTDESAEYANKEPISIRSQWLQTEADVKKLAEWIKTKIINKGKIINMEIFGVPMLSVGDIISVKYTYQGFSGTEKMVVTSINSTFKAGLEMSITARTL